MGKDTVDQVIDKYSAEPGYLIQILLDIQKENHWVSQDAINKVKERLNVPASRIQHIVTFYKAFSLVPKGRHEIQVCLGTACHVRGSDRVLEAIERSTGIRPGETDQELKFSLDTVNCLGCCALGPVIVVDGEYHGNMAPSKAEDVLKNYA
jgi:NADH-quinone oxidoreductase subunit E